ncbi:MAG TPA: DegT/DnrJ/EryC1/StrS family aminotransferase, partial [Acidimicrobiales bacterium]|nr:DegT/DnrJ/EryC1/StrS family aminotransferase [Acidimicrobiales bacterium]
HLSTQAREPFVHYEHVEAGFNYRLSNLLAALGRAQLLGLDQKIRRRRAINELYRQGLGELPGISFMPHAGYGNPNYWLTCILIDPLEFGSDREHVRLALERVDIESRPTWKPLHLQPLFAQAEVIGGRVCAEIFARGLCLPSGSAMSDDDVERVVEIVSRSART